MSMVNWPYNIGSYIYFGSLPTSFVSTIASLKTEGGIIEATSSTQKTSKVQTTLTTSKAPTKPLTLKQYSTKYTITTTSTSTTTTPLNSVINACPMNGKHRQLLNLINNENTISRGRHHKNGLELRIFNRCHDV